MYLKVKADCPLFSLHLANQSVSWHYLENNGGIQFVKLLWIVFFDESEMGVHWELLTFFVFPDPSKPVRLLVKRGLTQTFLLPTNAPRINCSVMLTQIKTVSV